MAKKYSSCRIRGILKVVFLDIDGVLNSELMYEICQGISALRKKKIKVPKEFLKFGKPAGKKYPYSEIDTYSISLLNDLIKRAKCKIVISSTWKNSPLSHQGISAKEILYKSGVIKGSIIGSTPNLGKGTIRGNEIRQWMAENNKLIGCYASDYHNYVILDDDSDMLLWQQYNYIHVDGWCGLTLNNTYKANYILNR